VFLASGYPQRVKKKNIPTRNNTTATASVTNQIFREYRRTPAGVTTGSISGWIPIRCMTPASVKTLRVATGFRPGAYRSAEIPRAVRLESQRRNLRKGNSILWSPLGQLGQTTFRLRSQQVLPGEICTAAITLRDLLFAFHPSAQLFGSIRVNDSDLIFIAVVVVASHVLLPDGGTGVRVGLRSRLVTCTSKT
jgi:hypothetical protein